jgi:hypothetical protein
MASQVSCALMGDSRPDSLVFCHAYGAQILEFPWLAFPGRLCRALWGRDEIAGDFHLLAILQGLLKGTKSYPFQSYGHEAFLNKFPQTSNGLSKANLER